MRLLTGAFFFVLCLGGFSADRSLATEPSPQAVEVAVDVKQAGPPISPYIYGQFIEHLGRCIYGGIWAEMIEDRKFFHAVGSPPSPWYVLGPQGAVVMSDRDPFVGAHAPEVRATGEIPCGIGQGGLGVIAGREYVGHAWLAGDADAAPVEISLAWGDGGGDRQIVAVSELKPDYSRVEFRFVPQAGSENARLEITARGRGRLRIGTLSLMPADNLHGMRADTVALLKELDSPIYRWPGGNFVSGYDWRDGIGDRDRRPVRKNPAWQGIEPNDFGIDEFMTFCRVLGTEPLVVVNTGLGDVTMALEQLEYVNGGPDTPMGSQRARNGHREPYQVRYWGIGNEMYGNWQLGHMPLEEYVRKHNAFVDAMRAKDPNIVVIAVGAVGPWTEGMFRHCADRMDLLSEHFYVGAKQDLAEHAAQAARRVREIAAAHRKYRQEILGGKAVPVALDEWNYWYGEHVFGELGTRYFLRDGLGVAKALNEFARNTDVYAMANYAQTVNVIGAIKTTNTAAALETTGWMLVLYRRHFGQVPVATRCEGPLDVQAALSEDGRFITLAVVNAATEAADIRPVWNGARLGDVVEIWEVAGDDPMAYNEPGKPPRVALRQLDVVPGKGLRVNPLSATIFRVALIRE